MKNKTDPREIEFRALMKKMAARDDSLIGDDQFDNFIRRELEERRGDRIYYVALCMDAWKPLSDLFITDEEAEWVRAELMEICSAFGRFGLAVLGKRKDPFSRIEEADRIADLMKKKLEAKREGEKSSAKTS